jgi:hypothetical protein
MKTQPKIATSYDTLCQLHKCSACLEINEKVKENVESCFIQQKLTFGRVDE